MEDYQQNNMRNDHYPQGTVRALLQTDLVTPQTKKVLQERLDKPVVTEPTFFTKEEFQTLQAVCKRLLPQPEERIEQIDLAGILDTNFSKGNTSNGWRYDAMPTDEEAAHQGLQAIETTSQSLYGKAFHKLETNQQDELLSHIQHKKIDIYIWKDVSSDLFFEELLSALAEIYYSHPVGKEDIGDVSFADTKGWHQIQINQTDEQEPKAVDKR